MKKNQFDSYDESSYKAEDYKPSEPSTKECIYWFVGTLLVLALLDAILHG